MKLPDCPWLCSAFFPDPSQVQVLFYVIFIRRLFPYSDSFQSPFYYNMHWMCIFILFNKNTQQSCTLDYTHHFPDHQQNSLTFPRTKLIPGLSRSVGTPSELHKQTSGYTFWMTESSIRQLTTTYICELGEWNLVLSFTIAVIVYCFVVGVELLLTSTRSSTSSTSSSVA